MMSMLYAWIVLLSFALINAVPVNGICGGSLSCDAPGLVCRNETCQCNTPFYNPCTTSCDVNRHFAYEGGDCEVSGNCIEHANCQDRKCHCDDGYTAKNGACFKKIDSVCSNNSECWSGYCSQSRCQCAPGLENVDNETTCRVKLVDVYEDWMQANAANAFCVNDDSCFDILGKCFNDSTHPQSKFCKCPSGYVINREDGRPRCEAVQGQYLSPLDEKAPSNYGDCGTCEDKNAVCALAASETTCWCRTGYEKKGKNCGSRDVRRIIFPNAEDVQLHDFTTGCSQTANEADKVQSGLCGCAPGYKFDDKSLPCRKIEPKWQSEYLEYGLCTQITSQDSSRSEDGVCPKPLKCEGRTDKHVCSCGTDKFVDLDDPTRCVYYIGKGTNGIDQQCPRNTRNGTSGNCECLEGYQVTPDYRQCELKLSSNLLDINACNMNITNHQMCVDLFGPTTRLCTIGECRCSGQSSFPSGTNDRCYAPVNQTLTPPLADCPHNSISGVDRCVCKGGFRPSGNSRECVRLDVSLTEYDSAPAIVNGDVTLNDCQALYKGPVEVYANDHCQCQPNAYVNENKDGCRYRLNTTVPVAGALFCPVNGSANPSGVCKCDTGFREENERCVRIADRVYSDNDPKAPNVTGINDAACRKFFGFGSKKALGGDYCICLPIAFPVQSDTYCHFFLNISSNDFKIPKTCPDNSANHLTGQPSACICDPGYHPSTSNQRCELAEIDLVGMERIDITPSCTRYTEDDCKAKFGPQAFCKGDQCYCNRQLSYRTDDNRCEPFSNYKFPGVHELYLHACSEDRDCVGERVICDYTDDSADYKVCRCEDGSFLEPKLQKCVPSRCMGCDESKNFECRGYVCQCKKGFVQSGSTCVSSTEKLQLYQRCNQSSFGSINNVPSLVCDSNCAHTTCNVGYRVDQLNCVRHRLGSDKCLNQEAICTQIDQNAACNRETNLCSCKHSYYQYKDQCVRAVGVGCREDDECGDGECRGNRCACKEGQRLETIPGIPGSELSRCVIINDGFNPLRANPVALFLFAILARIFFH